MTLRKSIVFFVLPVFIGCLLEWEPTAPPETDAHSGPDIGPAPGMDSTTIIMPVDSSLRPSVDTMNTGGTVVWERYAGSPGSDARRMEVLSSGDIVLAGVQASADVPTGKAFVMRLDAEGSVLWERAFHPGGTLGGSAEAIRETMRGDLIVCGTSSSEPAGSSGIYLLKLHPGGDRAWNITHYDSRTLRGNAVVETQDGGFLVAGSDPNDVMTQSGIFMLRTDRTGRIVGSNRFSTGLEHHHSWITEVTPGRYAVLGSTSYGEQLRIALVDDRGIVQRVQPTGRYGMIAEAKIALTADGGFMIYGTLIDDALIMNAFLIRTDAEGRIQWTFLGGTDSYGYDARQTGDGNYILCGSFGSSMSVIRIDASGEVIWRKTWGTPGSWATLRSIVQLHDGTFVACGYDAGGDPQRIYLIKLADS